MKKNDIRTLAKSEKTRKQIADSNLYAFYENIDFLTVKLSKAHPTLSTLNGIVINSDTMPLDFGPFKVQYFGMLAGDQLKVLNVTDTAGNTLVTIHILQETEKKNKNVSTDAEFVGLFWTAYQEYFPAFCDWLWIDTFKTGLVTRIDYCVDIAGIHSSQLLNLAYERRKRRKSFFVGNLETWRIIDNARHSIVVYDKKLDILDKNKHKIILPNDTRPFRKYLDPLYPIARVEFRKKARSIREIWDSSIYSLSKCIKQQFADHFWKNFDFDLQTFFEEQSWFDRKRVPKKEDPISTAKMKEKSEFYLRMFFAYADNYSLLNSEKKLFHELFFRYGSRITEHLQVYYREFPTEQAFKRAEYLLQTNSTLWK